MDKIKGRALTYSLLAHIRSKGQLISGPISVFVPLIKRTLSLLNQDGIFSGKSISEIKNKADGLYKIDFPVPVLRTILATIAKEINLEVERRFELFQDDSFQLKNYAFTEFEETIRIQDIEIGNLEKMFVEFCETVGHKNHSNSSILHFIEKNKLSLSKYLAHKQLEEGEDFTIEAQFVNYFKQIPPIYETIRKIYLGSIISGYLEYKTENIKADIELLLDTNFILGVFDLHTPESTDTCRKIMEIAGKQEFKLTVLRDTLSETTALLKAKSENFNLTFLQKKLYPEDIYNACDRRNLNSVDLERIKDNIEKDLLDFGVSIIYDTTKYKNKAKYSNEYEIFRQFRNSEHAALHDATAVCYVKEKRTKRIKDFENVNCWFINNSVTRDKYIIDKVSNLEFQPEMIKADDFLNVIWLSNPQIEKSLNLNEVSEIGLTSLISAGLTSSLPKLSIIKELDDNIHKYGQDGSLTDADIIRVATRITTKQLADIDKLNKLAKENRAQFVQRLNDEAKRQKELDAERIRKLDKVLGEFTNRSDTLDKLKTDFEEKSRTLDEKLISITGDSASKDREIGNLNRLLEEERKQRKEEARKLMAEKRDTYLDEAVRKWRRHTNIELIIWLIVFACGLLWLMNLSNWNIGRAVALYDALKANIILSSLIFIGGFIFTGVTFKKWYDKNHNHSNIENYKKGLKLPKELQVPD